MIKVQNKVASTVLALVLCASFLGPSTASAESFTFTRNITLGSRGADVSALQQILINGGFLKISSPTGYFGPLTKATLAAWQASVGISPASGFFGPISRKKIGATPSRVTTTTSTTVTTPTTTATVPGCTSTAGFSTTTGQACEARSAPVLVVVTPPAPSPVQTTSISAQAIANGSPVRIKIPKINVDAGFQYNGLKDDGSMEIPNNVVDVGWFTGSVHPGELGTSVITGHVSQIRGGVVTKPGVFFNLRDLHVGDTLAVTNDKGESFTFVVRETRNFDPAADATDVFTSKDNGAHMNIITCEGTWHPDQLSYSQRLVVFTDLVR